MSNYLNKNDPQFLFHKWVNQPDTVSDVLNDFEFWVEDEYDGSTDKISSDEADKIVINAIRQFLREDKKTKSTIAEYEQKLLSQWIKSSIGE